MQGRGGPAQERAGEGNGEQGRGNRLNRGDFTSHQFFQVEAELITIYPPP